MVDRVTTIALVNQSTVIADDEAATLARALHKQVTNDFARHWGTTARVYFYRRHPPPSAWLVALLDDSDQANALGYHDITDTGQPVAKVFVKTDQELGLSASVTASHEVTEMLGDPGCCSCYQLGTSETFVAAELCDPCEADRYGYTIDGVPVSDFVLASWFDPVTPPQGPCDFTGHITRPLSLLPGGYVSVWRPGEGWTQRFARSEEGQPPSRLVRSQRNARRNNVAPMAMAPIAAPTVSIGEADARV